MSALIPRIAPSLIAPNAPGNASQAQLKRSAQDFEATTLSELFEPMFDTVDMSGSPFGGGDAENSWKPIMVQEITKAVAAKGGLGIAGPVYETLLAMQEKAQQPKTGGMK